MEHSGYWCYCCDVQIQTEKQGYEHDVTIKHHERFEEREKINRRPVDKRKVPREPNLPSYKIFDMPTEERLNTQNTGNTSDVKPHLDSAKKKIDQPSKPTKIRLDIEHKPNIGKHNASASNSKIASETTSRSSKDQQGGMMMDILKTINKDSRETPSRTASSSNSRRSLAHDDRPRRLSSSKRPGEPSNLKDKFKYRRTSNTIQIPLEKLPNEQIPVTTQSSPVKSNLTADLDKAGELERMQVALTISQELDTLKVEQDQLETQVQALQSRLNKIKVRRKELKQRRANLLKGLAHSDTDEEEVQQGTSLLVGAECKNASAIHDKTFEKRIVSVAPVHSKSIALGIPPTDTVRVSATFQKPQVTTTNPASIVSPPRIAHVESTANAVQSPGPVHRYANTQGPKIASYTSNISTSSTNVPETLRDPDMINETAKSLETQQIRPSTTDSSHHPLISSNSQLNTPSTLQTPTSSQNLIPTGSVQNTLDLERLALIRQALQSPDSWQFTFNEVDQMLQRTAAKVAALKAQNPINTCSTSSVGSEVAQTIPSKSQDIPLHIKGEPGTFSPTSNAPTPVQSSIQTITSLSLPQNPNPNNTSSLTPNSHVLKPSQDSSSSFSSSDEDHGVGSRSHTISQKHSKKRLNSDLGMSKSTSSVTEGQSNPPTSTPDLNRTDQDTHRFANSFQSKDTIKYGEFHAFGGSPAAVTDMALRTTTRSVFVGGQNGSVVYFDLKAHSPIRTLPSRDASVTRMGLDIKERHLFIGYYDNYFAQYNAENGIKSHEKFFSSRIEAIAVTPLADVPFVFLGLANGDLLRHDINTYTTGVLCRHTSLHADYNLHESSRSESDIICDVTKKCESDCKSSNQPAGISSLAVVQSGTCLLLIVGGQDNSLTIRTASDGTLLWFVQSAPHKGPPQGIASLPSGSLFMSYFERTIRIHNWKTGTGVLTFQTQKITSSCVMKRYIALGDSEGAIRVYRIQETGLPSQRPMKVYFASARTAITCLTSSGDALIVGSMDGTVTTLWVNEPASDYVCLYGPFGQNCGIGFNSRKDLVQHVLDTHLIFGNQKSIMCRWGAGRCRVRFTETQTMKSISDHLLTHIPD